ncbi:alpha/beta hydrolase [Methylobacterium segetis]|uniref:alpha/beta hydrolase n=1 Tax=Methylobacterium segetis TaxID=2488750 RepID=UPI00104DA59D|nr:alpha/beta hydrolase [Methylobacterium segetis]
MRIVSLLFLSATALYVGAVGLLAAFQRSLIYPGASLPGAPIAADPPEGVQSFGLRTGDGETLRALWRPPEPGCGVVLTFHGNGSRPEPHAARFGAGPWAANGWGVLAIAYRGYPGSTGSPSEDGLLADGEAAYREVARRAPGAPILLHGHSLGTGVAAALARGHAALGLYLEAPFDSMAAMVRLRFPLAPPGLLLDTYRSDERLAGATIPVLIVHGLSDPVIPASFGRRLAEAVGQAAHFEAVPGDHVSILGTSDGKAEAFFRGRIEARCLPSTAE